MICLKTKVRNIVVNYDHYVYWYLGGHGFNLYISPQNDKTIQVKISFQFNAPPENKYMFWAFYKITANYRNTKTTICIAEPRFVATLISYLLLNHEKLFEKGKVTILNAVELLHAMGYSEVEPIWIKEW